VLASVSVLLFKLLIIDLHSIIFSCCADDSSIPEPGVSEIRRMAVSPKYRRRGIASALLRVAVDYANATKHREQISYLALSTSEFQPDAMRLYERLGWREIGRYTFVKVLLGMVKIDVVCYRRPLDSQDI
jgi:GNAT superfamily N-acetyltransferase